MSEPQTVNGAPEETARPLIQLQDLTKVYSHGSQEVPAVVGLDLAVEKGAFAVLAGPSGSGKTTVLNLVGGLDRPTRGTVHLAGQNLAELTSRNLADFRLRRIGFIFQAYNLIPVLTALENAEFTLMLQGVAGKERVRKISTLFEQLGIAGLQDRRPRDLSGGQQQRVAIARAMAADPAVILADEPTANLDSKTAEDLLALMRGINNDRGTTFLFSSHDPRVISHARRVIHLRDGRLESDQDQNG